MIFLQRNARNVADVTFSGDRARILKDGAVYRDWSAGGVIKDVPQGSGYTLEITRSGTTSTESLSIGIIVGTIGQSNMNHWYSDWDTGRTMVDASSNTFQLQNGKWSAVQGDATRTFANLLSTSLDVPVGIVDGSLGGTALLAKYANSNGNWEATGASSLYGKFISSLNGVGGHAEIIVWIQGETDTGAGATTDEYLSGLNNLFGRLRADASPSTILSSSLGATLSGNPDWTPYFNGDQAAAIRTAQSIVDAASPDVIFVDTKDLELDDNIHRTTVSSSVEAVRLAEAFLQRVGIESVEKKLPATESDDTINGTDAAELIEGHAGNDTINGNNGNDIVRGEAGADTIDGGNGADMLSGGSGNDIISGGAGSDRIFGDVGNDLIYGDGDDDIINGGDGNDTIYGGAGNDSLSGNIGNDFIYGGDGVDRIKVGAGNDTVDSGGGDDLIVFDNLTTYKYIGQPFGYSDIKGGEGNDTLRAAANGTVIGLASIGSVETITADGHVSVSIAGSADANVLDFRSTTMVGIVRIDGNGGNDTIYGSAGSDKIYGGAGEDIIDAGAGNDVLSGGTGNDTLIGGSGADNALFYGKFSEYSIDFANKTISSALEGTDTIDGVEFLVFSDGTLTWSTGSFKAGTAGVVINGTDAGETLTSISTAWGEPVASIYNDQIYGFGGADTIDGGAGADLMVGGAAGDTYYVDNPGDIIVELANEGTDLVNASVSYTLSDNVERLVLIGTSAIDGVGNALANFLTGNAAANTLTGLAGDDRLDGGAGADTMVGGLGSDIYTVDDVGDRVQELANEGTEFVNASVSYTLSDNVENLTLTGTAAVDGVGNALGNTLLGNAAANILTGLAGDDRLDGAAGADTMIGGLGGDFYTVDNAGDRVQELANEGTDTVNASVSYTLSDNVEKIVLTGTTAIDGVGNALANFLTGNAAANTLAGLAGDDRLDGAAGADTMIGGLGNDIYTVDDVGDRVQELANEGTDTVNASVSYTLSDNVENLTLTGTAAIDARGNALANTLLGNAAANILTGGAGNDRIDGAAGSDTAIFSGVFANYVLDRNAGKITSAAEGADTLVNVETLVFANGIYDWASGTFIARNNDPTLSIGAQSVLLVETGAGTAGTATASIALVKADVDAGDTTSYARTGWADLGNGRLGKTGTYGSAVLDTATGLVVYALDNDRAATQALASGTMATDSFSVTVLDSFGATVTKAVVFNISGTDDAAVLSSALVSLTEADTAAALSAYGALTASDVDGPIAFRAQSDTQGAYGRFSVDADGAWRYVASSAHDEFAAGSVHTERFTVTATDGSTTSVTLVLTGTDDAAVLSSAAVSLDEADTAAALSTSGALTASDVDGPIAFRAQSDTQGAYGRFSVDADGAWRYVASSAHDEFAAGSVHTERFTVTATDGSTTSVTLVLTGTDDAAVLSSAAVSLDEADTAAALSTSGALTASDVDGPIAFRAQSDTQGAYGRFSVDADGAWRYVASSAHDEFAAGSVHTERFTVTATDGSTTSVTLVLTGIDDAAVLSSAAVSLDEADTAAALSTSGALTASDVDGPIAFRAQRDTQGAYGRFSVDADGAWRYVASSAHDEFAAGSVHTERFTVTATDGSTTSVTLVLTGIDDAAVLSSAAVSLDEADTAAALSTSGALTASDVDGPIAFRAQSDTQGAYGRFSVDADGAWRYVASSAHDEFAAGSVHTERFTVTATDGSTTSVTLVLTGTDDAAVLSSAAVSLDEADTAAALSTSGALTASDVDGPIAFRAQSDTQGAYGRFSVDADGAWRYVASSAHDEFAAGSVHTERFTVTATDGSTTSVTLVLTGIDDAAVLSSAAVSLDEADTAAALSTSGALTASDVDGPIAFRAQSDTQGAYGRFSVDADGAWRYVASSAHDEFAAGSVHTERFTVTATDGSTTSVTLVLTGTDDAAVLSSAAVSLDEADTAAALSTSGALTASDVDGPIAFRAQSDTQGAYGRFSVDADGAWRYVASSAHDEFAAGSVHTERFTVTATDGSTTSVTLVLTGIDDAAVLSSAAVSLDEADTAAALSTSGALTASDVDGPIAFRAQSDTQGAYGRFSVDADGAWRYVASSAHDEFAAGSVHTERFTVTATDGSTTSVTLVLTGTDDAAVLSSAAVSLDEADTAAALSTSGALTASDVDGPIAFRAQSDTQGAYGRFSVDADGAWRYVASSAHDEFAAGSVHTERFTVTATDGSTTSVTLVLTGTDDAAVLSSAAVSLDEADTAAALSTSGALTASDVDGPIAFRAQSDTQGAYGRFSVDADGAWRYVASSAHDEFAAGSVHTERFTVTATDGSTTSVTLVLTGTDDAAVLSSAAVSLDEADTAAALSTSGALTASDVDGPIAFRAQSDTQGAYGRFSVDADGAWRYVASSAHDEFAAGSVHTERFTVTATDGSTTSVTLVLTGIDDAAVLSSAAVSLDEADTAAALSTSGALTASDVDGPIAFRAQSDTQGAYGRFSVDADGAWRYVASSAHDEFAAGSVHTERFTVTATDGSTTSVTLVLTGTDDAAVLSSAAVSLDEADTAAALSTSGALTASDVDGPIAFRAQSDTQGAYGRFSVDADGAWRYVASSAHDEFAAGSVHTERFTVTATDGSTTSVTLVLTGTDDAAVLSSAAVSLDEADTAAALSTSGALTASDVDGPIAFRAQSDTQGAYGRFSVDADGAWRYVASSAHDEFAAGSVHTERFTVTATDGSTTSVTLVLTGTDDAAVLSSAAVSLDEADTAAALSTSGALTASDVDGPIAFRAQSDTQGAYGRFSVDADGAWRYVASSAHDEFAAGSVHTERFTVTATDGSTTSVTLVLTGTDDAAVLSSAAVSLDEADTAAALSTSGALTASDVDGPIAFRAQSDTQGAYGRFSVDADGAWRYVASSAHDEFAAGSVHTERFTVTATDGSTTSVTLVLTGTDDAAVLSSAAVSLDEADTAAALSTSGALTASDVDGPIAFRAQSDTQGAYGRFSVDADGAWRYVASSAHDEFAAGSVHTERFTVTATDGSTTSVTLVLTGIDDAAVLSSAAVSLDEADTAAALSTSGALTASDVDGPIAFRAQSDTQGAYGRFSVDADGAWRYVASSAHDEFAAGSVHTERFTVTATDGSTTSVTLVLTGTDDAAVLSSAAVSLDEADTAAALSTSGALTASDVDGPIAFRAQSDTQGAYGRFSVDADGAWRYVASSAHDEFAAGSVHTERFTVTATDGSATSVTLVLTGTDDAATLSIGAQSVLLVETGAGTAGTATASIALVKADVDAGDTTSYARTGWADLGNGRLGKTGTYGSAVLDTATGLVVYALDNDRAATQALAGGTMATDSFSVTVLDSFGATVTKAVVFNISGTDDAVTITGTSGNDRISPTATVPGQPTPTIYADTLYGLAGDDRLDGGAGADTMVGGLGSDIYTVDDVGDRVQELANEGTEFVNASVSYTLSDNVENLTLTGTAAVDGVGNALGNTLLGNAAANILTGLAGDDRLDGAAGADTMIGGLGGDFYTVDNAGDRVQELANEGTDTVNASVSYTLSDNVEKIVLTGTTAIDGVGNALANFLTGNAAANTLAGLAGDDRLDGAAGADTMIGGLGNDIYTVDDVGDRVQELANEGTDTVNASVSYTLSDNVENLTLTGTAAIDARGNALANTLLGNAAANILTGGAGNDRIDGAAGSDTAVFSGVFANYVLDRNAGKITSAAEGADTLVNVETLVFANGIYDWASGTFIARNNDPTLSIGAQSVLLVEAGAGTAGTATASIALVKADVDAGDTTSYARTGWADLGNGRLGKTGTYGSAVLDTATGLVVYALDNDRAATQALAGGTMATDSFSVTVLDSFGATVTKAVVFNISGTDDAVTITGTSGNDRISPTATVPGQPTPTIYADTLYGLAGDDRLDGGAGADTMVGGLGSDIYTVDDVGDRVQELANEGTEFVNASVSYTLSDNVENLTLTGTAAVDGVGNALGNTLLGNAAANILTGLAGDDRLDGAAGADTMIGGLGGDFYTVDNAGDRVQELANEGTDTVNASVSYTLSDNVEKIVLTGTTAIDGVGNALANFLTGNAAANTLAGLAGDDRLDGAAGADTMIGGLGNDIYTVDDVGDRVQELANEGTDTVNASVSYTLSDNVENLTLTGTAAIDARGNALANTLLGNAAANILTGGAGNDRIDGAAGSDTLIGGLNNDTLNGGAGADIFVFNSSVKGGQNIDTILDFNINDDILMLDSTIFSNLTVGSLTDTAFYVGKSALNADQHVIYDDTTGKIFYDQDGIGGENQIQFAVISAGTALNISDLLVV